MKSKKYIKIQFDNKILFRSRLTKLIKDLDNLCKKLSLSNTEYDGLLKKLINSCPEIFEDQFKPSLEIDNTDIFNKNIILKKDKDGTHILEVKAINLGCEIFFVTFKHVVCKYSKRCYLSPITKNSYIYPLIRYNY